MIRDVLAVPEGEHQVSTPNTEASPIRPGRMKRMQMPMTIAIGIVAATVNVPDGLSLVASEPSPLQQGKRLAGRTQWMFPVRAPRGRTVDSALQGGRSQSAGRGAGGNGCGGEPIGRAAADGVFSPGRSSATRPNASAGTA